MARKAGAENATSDYQNILKDPEVDLVMVTTRHNLHARMVIEALRNGKSVFVEKPLCLNETELDDIIRAYQGAPEGTTLTVGFNRRFSPFAEKMRRLLGDGPKNIVATMNAGFIPREVWVHDLEIGGGRIIGEACHFIDLCSFLAGSEVVAVCMNALGENPEENTDNASILLRYANGTNAVINYFANGSKSYAKERVEVFSQERVLVLDNWRKLTGYGFKGFSSMKAGMDKGQKRQFTLLNERIREGLHYELEREMLGESLKLYISTLRNLRSRQVRYQVWYRLRAYIRKYRSFRYVLSLPRVGHPLSFKLFISKYTDLDSVTGHFSFLGTESAFLGWNDESFGKLWSYNLNYMDYLHQETISFEQAVCWIDKFVDEIEGNRNGLEPYPIALRGINWIKFLSKYHPYILAENKRKWDSSLYAQYQILLDNLEYHLLGNHLLEDAFSLLWAGLYFKDEPIYQKAKGLLLRELEEQLLPDGAHYEQSPMYHCILLDRLLDCYNVSVNNLRFIGQEGLNERLREKAGGMLGHLASVVYKDNTIPLLNDSAEGIAPSPTQLFAYAKRLDMDWEKLPMGACGYRKLMAGHWEAIVDVGDIRASYQPGHSHADTFNYELRIGGKPFVMDTGISTYEKTARRQYERGTAAHNTVVLGDKNSSEVWGGFRVGRRARVTLLKDSPNEVEAWHDGFGSLGRHLRKFTIDKDRFRIEDSVSTAVKAVSLIHLAPDVEIISCSRNEIVTSIAAIRVAGASSVEIVDDQVSFTYNRFHLSKTIRIHFVKRLSYTIG